jgi:hypothetical protein
MNVSSKLKKIRPESANSAISIADSEYRSIPNNFKKEGVAFTSTKINFDAGISGIYNMGNTCFMSTGNKFIFFSYFFSCPMSECSLAFN